MVRENPLFAAAEQYETYCESSPQDAVGMNYRRDSVVLVLSETTDYR